MRLYLTSSVVNVDVRVMHRSVLGRSLVYGCVDVLRKPPPGRFDERRERVPYTVVKLDIERVDEECRGPALEYVMQVGERQLSNRTFYVAGTGG